MNFIISGRNMTVTPGLKDAIISKLGKLERYFTPEDRGNHSSQGGYYPFRTGKHRYVCID